MTDNHPKLLAIVLPDNKRVPFSGAASKAIVSKIVANNFMGTVENNSLTLAPNPGFTLEHKGEGLYKVTHNIGWEDTCLSISLLVQPGSFEIKEHGPVSFTIQTMLDRKPKDMGFMFAITRVISPAPGR